ncbi:catenin alpha-3 isoform X1 [Lepisosteus oculatus]|uniref:catenin alpha-3 isoform X1 n=2 Tax=Lepisosteus oculatus TaxID=7918 RepID=UPI0035F519F8
MASLWESGTSCTIRTRSVERVVAPIAAQVCRLLVGGGRGGRGEAPAPLEEAAAAVAAAMRRLAAVASRLAEESEDDILRKEMGTATDCVLASGQNLLLAAQKLNIQPTSPDHREELIISAQNVLLGTLKILLVEDDAAVREIVTAAHWLLDCLTQLESAPDIPSLLKSFRSFSEALLLLNNLAEKRLEELRDPAQQRNLVHSLETLKKCISMLYTAMHTTIKHPQNEQARAAKKYVLDQADTSITELILLLKSNFSENTSASQGYYTEKLQGLLQLLSSSSCSSIRGSDFDSLLRDLVIYCMVVANTSRKERQLIVIKYCQRVLHHWSEISRQAKLLGNSPDSKQTQQDIEDNCVSMKNELQNLDNSILTAILYQSVDVFTAPNTLFEKLISVATESTNDSSELDHLQPPLTAFLAHADRVIQVAGFISACSTGTKNIMNIESSRTRLKQLKDSIVPSLLELGKTSLCSEALGKLQELYRLWAEEVDQLLGSLTDVINIKQLLDLCIQELMTDKRECEKAHTSQSASQFEEHSVRLIGRMNYVVITAKRHVDKSDNPVFRNGLLVLIKQVENCASHTTLAVHHCLKHCSDVKPFSLFSETVLKSIKQIHILRAGLDGFSHPHLLSPLREEARQRPLAQLTDATERAGFSTWDIKNENTALQCQDKCSEKAFIKPMLQAHTHSNNPSIPVFSDITKSDQNWQNVDLLPNIRDVLSATKGKDISTVNMACKALLELSNCYLQAAKEASAIIESVDIQKLASLQSDIISLTPIIIKTAQEAAINPALDTETMYKRAAVASDRMTELRQILLPAAGGWYHAVHGMLQNHSQKNISKSMQDINKIIQSCSDVVQSAIISPTSDIDCALRTAPHESIAMLYSKLKKAQANAKHLLEVVSALPAGSDRLEGPCILWSLSIQVLLNSLDKLLGAETLNDKGQCFDHTVTPQKRLVIFSENSLRIQEAARLSTFICKDNNINKKIVDLQKEVQVLTEAYLQSADGLSRIPLSNINRFAQSELLQRKLQIKMKMLCALIGMINTEYEETIKNILHLSILATTGNKDEKISAQRNFEREAEQLLQNIKVTSQNVQDCLNYIRDPRVRLNLKFINEHLSFETTDIISRAREVIETQNFHEIPSLEIRVTDWSAKANYLVTEIYKVNEIHQETKNRIRQHLQCRSLMEAHNVSAENSLAHNRQKKPEGNTVSSWQTKNPVNSDKEDIHRPPIQKHEPEKDSNAPIREIRTSSTTVSLSDTALFLKKETDKWQDENNKIVQVTKEMAAQIYYMVQYLKKKGPIKTKDEFITSAKCIAANGQLISKFVQIIADHCLDRHCSAELTHTVEQILTISNQLNIISSVKAATEGDRTSDEILVKNSQNLLHTALQGMKAAETACIKGLKQPPPNTDEAEAAALCFRWKQNLQIHRARQASNPEMDELGLRKTSLNNAAPSLAALIKMQESL